MAGKQRGAIKDACNFNVLSMHVSIRVIIRKKEKYRRLPPSSLPRPASLCDTNWAILFSRRAGKAKVAEKEGSRNAGSLGKEMAKRKLNRPSMRRQIGGKRILKNGEGREGDGMGLAWSKKGTRRGSAGSLGQK